jgi:hypothetical protein
MVRTKTNELKVFISNQESKCGECNQDLGRRAWIMLHEKKGALCLSCADFDHLVFLPSGDAALTRRARKHSRLSAVVLKWSRTRKRYERQGLLVESEALAQADYEWAADEETRKAARLRAAARRAELDQEFVHHFAVRLRELYPYCPKGREDVIAEHACRKYSGRVGRSAAAKALDEDAVRLAVAAHVRHAETEYDDLLLRGFERWEARESVRAQVDKILSRWQYGKA